MWHERTGSTLPHRPKLVRIGHPASQVLFPFDCHLRAALKRQAKNIWQIEWPNLVLIIDTGHEKDHLSHPMSLSSKWKLSHRWIKRTRTLCQKLVGFQCLLIEQESRDPMLVLKNYPVACDLLSLSPHETSHASHVLSLLNPHFHHETPNRTGKSFTLIVRDTFTLFLSLCNLTVCCCNLCAFDCLHLPSTCQLVPVKTKMFPSTGILMSNSLKSLLLFCLFYSRALSLHKLNFIFLNDIVPLVCPWWWPPNDVTRHGYYISPMPIN